MPAKRPNTKAAHQREVKMPNDEIGIVQLPVEGRDSQHDAREPGDQKLKQKCEQTASASETDFAALHGGHPIENLDARRNRPPTSLPR